MKTRTSKSKLQREHLYKLIDSFNENELYAIQRFAEFLKKNNGDDRLMQLLLRAPYEDKELSEQTIKDIEKSEQDIKKGRYKPLSKVMKQYGL